MHPATTECSFPVKICWPVQYSVLVSLTSNNQNRLPEIGVVAWLMTLAWWISGRRRFRARGGKGVSPFLSLRGRSRAKAGAPSKPTRPPPPGAIRRKGVKATAAIIKE